jgi:hypothetical protein
MCSHDHTLHNGMRCGMAELAESQEKKGRPRKREAALSMRIASATRNGLVEKAKQHGRSTTQEADRLLHLGMLVDKMSGAGLQKMLPALMAFDRAGSNFAREQKIGDDWIENAEAYQFALHAAVEMLLENIPGPWDGRLAHAIVEQAFIRAQTRRAVEAGYRWVWPNEQPDQPPQE